MKNIENWILSWINSSENPWKFKLKFDVLGWKTLKSLAIATPQSNVNMIVLTFFTCRDVYGKPDCLEAQNTLIRTNVSIHQSSQRGLVRLTSLPIADVFHSRHRYVFHYHSWDFLVKIWCRCEIFVLYNSLRKKTKGKLPAAGGKFWVSLLENIMTLVVFCQIWNEGGRSPATTFLDFFGL